MVPRRKLPSPSAACIPLSGTATWSAPGGKDREIRGRTGPGTRSANRVGAGSSRRPDDQGAARQRLAHLFGLLRLIENVPPIEVAMDDASIAGRFGVSIADVRQVIRIGWRSRRLDVVLDYVCLPARPAERRSAA